MNPLLNKWMIINSNGDWEHENQITICTTDIPGWSIKIDLKDTALESAEYLYTYKNGNEYIDIKIDNNVYIGYCSLDNLSKCIELFFEDLFPKHFNANFRYQLFLPVIFDNKIFWREAYGVLTPEFKIKIVEIPALVETYLKAEIFELLTSTDFTNINEAVCKIQIGEIYDFNLKHLYDGAIPVVEQMINKD